MRIVEVTEESVVAMKSTVSAVVSACLIVSLLAGCATGRGPRQVDAAFRGGTPPETNWSRVGQLAPAAAIVVTAKGSQAGSRYFVAADESALIVLNLSHPTLSARSTRVLRDMASKHPEYFVAVLEGGTFGQDNVRVGRDGLLVAGRKIADLDRVVVRIARGDVSEIRGPVVARGSALGAVLGGWLGFAVGVVPGLGGASAGVTWLVLTGSVAVGGFLGYRWSSHETEGVVYRAP
jgi:hypothetical protein